MIPQNLEGLVTRLSKLAWGGQRLDNSPAHGKSEISDPPLPCSVEFIADTLSINAAEVVLRDRGLLLEDGNLIDLARNQAPTQQLPIADLPVEPASESKIMRFLLGSQPGSFLLRDVVGIQDLVESALSRELVKSRIEFGEWPASETELFAKRNVDWLVDITIAGFQTSAKITSDHVSLQLRSSNSESAAYEGRVLGKVFARSLNLATVHRGE